jgi:hypothetical protein
MYTDVVVLSAPAARGGRETGTRVALTEESNPFKLWASRASTCRTNLSICWERKIPWPFQNRSRCWTFSPKMRERTTGDLLKLQLPVQAVTRDRCPLDEIFRHIFAPADLGERMNQGDSLIHFKINFKWRHDWKRKVGNSGNLNKNGTMCILVDLTKWANSVYQQQSFQ